MIKYLIPPATDKEQHDLILAIRNNIPENEFTANQEWYQIWGMYLIALRRGYQKRFISEAYDDKPQGT